MDTTYKFTVSNAVVLVPKMKRVVLVDDEGNLIFQDGKLAVRDEVVLDQYGAPVFLEESKTLIHFVQKADQSEAQARAIYNRATNNRYPQADQILYEPSPEQWEEDWNSGIGNFIIS